MPYGVHDCMCLSYNFEHLLDSDSFFCFLVRMAKSWFVLANLLLKLCYLSLDLIKWSILLQHLLLDFSPHGSFSSLRCCSLNEEWTWAGLGLQGVRWFVLWKAIVVVEDVGEVEVCILLTSHCLQTFIDLDHHVVSRFFAQHHHDKFYNIVNKQVYIPMGNLLMFFLLEPSDSVLDNITLGCYKVPNFINRFCIQQLGLRHHFNNRI